jgi:hypothetical protein
MMKNHTSKHQFSSLPADFGLPVSQKSIIVEPKRVNEAAQRCIEAPRRSVEAPKPLPLEQKAALKPLRADAMICSGAFNSC